MKGSRPGSSASSPNRELAIKYKISLRQPRKRGSEEKWVRLREQKWNKIATKSLQKPVNESAKEIAEMEVRHATTGSITPVFNLVAEMYAKAKELGIPLPDLPGFPPE